MSEDSERYRFEDAFCPRINPKLAARSVGGHALILDPSSDRLIKLNPTGTWIWDQIVASKSFGEIVSGLVEAYEVDSETARQDVKEYLQFLLDEGLLEGDRFDDQASSRLRK